MLHHCIAMYFSVGLFMISIRSFINIPRSQYKSKACLCVSLKADTECVSTYDMF